MTKINLRWLQNMKWSGRSIFLFVFFLCFDFFACFICCCCFLFFSLCFWKFISVSLIGVWPIVYSLRASSLTMASEPFACGSRLTSSASLKCPVAPSRPGTAERERDRETGNMGRALKSHIVRSLGLYASHIDHSLFQAFRSRVRIV